MASSFRKDSPIIKKNHHECWRRSPSKNKYDQRKKSTGLNTDRFYRKTPDHRTSQIQSQSVHSKSDNAQVQTQIGTKSVGSIDHYPNGDVATISTNKTTTTGRRRNRGYFDTKISPILRSALQRSSSNQCNEWYTKNLKSRRAVFREVSFLKNFPVQDLAMKEFQNQLDIHFGKTNHTDEKNKIHTLSSTSSSSLECEDEGKDKRRRDQMNEDVSLCTKKAQWKVEFLRERAATKEQRENHASNDSSKTIITTATKYDRHGKSSSRIDINDDEDKDNDFLPPLWSMEPRIFAIEMSKTGKRKYVVGSYGRIADLFWRKVSPTSRHYYELIREETPCRLYFDLEFCKIANPEISSSTCEMILDELFLELCTQFQTLYPTQIPSGSMTRSCIIDLDSSTSQKFSRHWIVHLPHGTLFANAVEAGFFVKLFVGQLADDIATGVLQNKRPMLAKYLFVKVKSKNTKRNNECMVMEQTQANETTNYNDSNHDNQCTNNDKCDHHKETIQDLSLNDKTCIIDLGVYTRNRLFRLIGAAKYGKPPSAALRIAEANQFPFPDEFGNNRFYLPMMGKMKDEEEFLEMSKKTDEELVYENKHNTGMQELKFQKFRAAMDWSIHAEVLAQTLVVPLNSTKIKFPILPNPAELDEAANILPQTISKRCTRTTSSSRNTISNGTTNNGMGPSPFPCLDKYISDVLGQRGCTHNKGMIRAWSMNLSFGKNENVGMVTYQMCQNRYCENIGRAHKSNNIMWIVDLFSLHSFQSCHDPDCRAAGFRGSYIPLPEEVKADVKDILFDMEMMEMDENKLIEEAKINKSNKTNTIADKSNNTTNTNPWDDEEFDEALSKWNIDQAVITSSKFKITGMKNPDNFGSTVCLDVNCSEKNIMSVTRCEKSKHDVGLRGVSMHPYNDDPENNPWDDVVFEEALSRLNIDEIVNKASISTNKGVKVEQ